MLLDRSNEIIKYKIIFTEVFRAAAANKSV